MKLWKGQVWVNDRGRTVVIGDINNHHTYATFSEYGGEACYSYDGLLLYMNRNGYKLSKKSIIQEFFNTCN